jgi:hypothetical protein
MKNKSLTKAQLRVIDALKQPGARMNPPRDMSGYRTGFVTNNGSVSGWMCPVTLQTKNTLESMGLITNVCGHFYLSDKGKTLFDLISSGLAIDKDELEKVKL